MTQWERTAGTSSTVSWEPRLNLFQALFEKKNFAGGHKTGPANSVLTNSSWAELKISQLVVMPCIPKIPI